MQIKYTIGVDVGGTNTQLALVDIAGRIVARDYLPTTGHPDAASYVKALGAKVTGLVEANGARGQVKGIGIGAPCANAASGVIEGATNLPWPSPIPLVDLVEKATGISTVISNDANAAAVGEMTYGSARGCRNFIMLTLGTGVGAGVICDGHLLSGSRGFAGELGHIFFHFAADRSCECGRNGCLQTVASAGGVVETARRMLAADVRPSALRDIPAPDLNARAIGEAADAGDRLAIEVFDFTGRCLGEACATFAAFTDPDAVILFGGVAKAARFMLPAMREAIEKHALHIYRNRIKVSVSSLPDSDAAILGAASLPFINTTKS